MKIDELDVVTYAERPELLDQMQPAIDSGFPAFLMYDAVWNECWPVLLETWPDLHVFLVDTEGMPVAMVSAIPLFWDGDPAHLPPGTHASMQRAVEQRELSGFDTACAIQAVKHPGYLGQGVGQAVLRALFAKARALGYARVVSPIRPTMKDAYPTIPMSRYLSWRRADGLPLDAWLRTSQRVGGPSCVCRKTPS